MPEYQTFLDGENMAQFWDWVKWFLFFVAPIIMIFFALDAVGLTIQIIKKVFGSAEKQKDDDDDYDVYRY